jgi:hypothetical protein
MIRTSKTTFILLCVLFTLAFVEVGVITQILFEVQELNSYIQSSGVW